MILPSGLLGNIWTIYWFAFWKLFTCFVCLFWYRTLCIRHSCTRQGTNGWWQDLVPPNSFLAKIALAQVRMQTLANFTLCSTQIVPCWPIWPFSGRLARFPLPHATRCDQINHKGTGLYFEFANENIHLPKNPLGPIVNGLCFSPDNVFSIRCI